jgi:hypothetical protein
MGFMDAMLIETVPKTVVEADSRLSGQENSPGRHEHRRIKNPSQANISQRKA